MAFAVIKALTARLIGCCPQQAQTRVDLPGREQAIEKVLWRARAAMYFMNGTGIVAYPELYAEGLLQAARHSFC